MLTRFTLAATALVAFAGLAAAQPPAPTLVVNVQPVSRGLADLKEIIRQVGGPTMGNDMVKEFEKGLKEALGEKGFEGFDVNRPTAAYGVLKEKPEDSSLVLLIPVSGEKEFLELLGRIQIKSEAVKDKKGVYKLEAPEAAFPKASHLQFTNDGWAYVTLNDGEPTDAKNLIPVGDLLKNASPALFSVKFYPGRVPAKLATAALDQLDEGVNGIKGFIGAGPDPASKFAKTYLEQFPKLLRRYTETAIKDVEEISGTFTFNAPSGDLVAEMTIVPKAGSATAKEFAARPATTNRFAGLMSKDAVFGVTMKAPLFAPEVREMSVALIDLIDAGLKQAEVPEKLRPVLEEVTKGFVRSVKSEKLDAAVGLVGPDKGGKFAVVAGLSFEDTAALEKAMRAAAKDSTLAKEFEFDVAKVGDVSIHKVPFSKLFPADADRELARAFGDKPTSYVAFAKDAIFFTFGSGALDAIKAAAAAKPGPAPAFDLTWNSGRVQKFVATMDERAGIEVAKILGTDDKAASAMRLTVEGGQTLKLKGTFNVRYLPKMMMGAVVSGAEFQPVPPPPVAIPAKN